MTLTTFSRGFDGDRESLRVTSTEFVASRREKILVYKLLVYRLQTEY